MPYFLERINQIGCDKICRSRFFDESVFAFTRGSISVLRMIKFGIISLLFINYYGIISINKLFKKLNNQKYDIFGQIIKKRCGTICSCVC